MAKIKLQLTKSFDIDTEADLDKDRLDVIRAQLTEEEGGKPYSWASIHDAIREILGDDLEALVDLEDITDQDFEITVPEDVDPSLFESEPDDED